MSLPAGTSLGPHQILAPIGAGGMGEVYRARDPRLGREVAVKVLPASEDPDRLRRFEQEARTAGALNHPNVLAVYDVGTHDGTAPRRRLAIRHQVACRSIDRSLAMSACGTRRPATGHACAWPETP